MDDILPKDDTQVKIKKKKKKTSHKYKTCNDNNV